MERTTLKKNNTSINITFLTLVVLVLTVIFYFNRGLSVSLFLLSILSAITFFVLNRLGLKDKKKYWLFLIVIIIHLCVTLFMYYANFQPFSGGTGDYIVYQKSAVEISQSFRQGNFSINNIALEYPDLYTGHYYPTIVGILYFLTMPEEIIGLTLNIWLVALSVIFVYLIILEIGGEEKNAFIIGIITAIYPSYLFNTSLLLKDAFEVCFVIFGLLVLIKIIKKFTWYNFLIFYLILICVTHFRFYIGYALIYTFIFSWFLFSKLNIKKRIIYGIIFIIVLGFIPQIAYNQGYYGINSVEKYLNVKTVNFYRYIVYNPVTYNNPALPSNVSPVIGLDSSFQTGGGIVGYLKSFIYVLLGPFPWQIKNLRQLLALFETIPWYLLLFLVVNGIIICFKKHIREAVPLLIFSVITLVVIAIFDTNFGLIVRIRIPAFISLLCIASFGFNKNNKLYNYLKNIYEKIFSYWRGRIYRLKHS